MFNFKKIVSFAVSASLVCAFSMININDVSAGTTCCDRMRLTDKYITSETSSKNEHYDCLKHHVVEICTIKTKTDVYHRVCTSCGAYWKEIRKSSTTHTGSCCKG